MERSAGTSLHAALVAITMQLTMHKSADSMCFGVYDTVDFRCTVYEIFCREKSQRFLANFVLCYKGWLTCSQASTTNKQRFLTMFKNCCRASLGKILMFLRNNANAKNFRVSTQIGFWCTGNEWTPGLIR